MSREREQDEWLEPDEWLNQVDEDMEQKNVLFENDEGDYLEERESYMDFDDSDGLEAYLSEAVAQVTGDKSKEDIFNEYADEEDISTNRWSIKKKILVGLSTTVGVAVFGVIMLMGSLLFGINYVGATTMAETDLTPEELAAQATLPPRDDDMLMLDEKIINVLLIGEERIGTGDGNGRSDSMMIASVNTEEKTLKVVSIMRDSYVSIPGYRDNKLNAAFSYGGGELLCSTIEQNFGVQLDGYVRVDFEGFRQLIDELGGVEIELTEAEALYLNTTNYIKKKSARTMVPGKQIASGTQALGYCRVRKRAAINGENDDFGRTYRQRAVITQVYEKVKKLNVAEAVSLVNKLLPYISTNISKKDILTYAKAILQMGIPEVQQKRIPVNNGYTGQNLHCGSSLVLNFDLNNRELWSFIYGDGVGDIITIHPSSVSSYDYSSDTTDSSTTTTVTTRPTTAVVVTDAPEEPDEEEDTTPTEDTVVTEEPVITEEPKTEPTTAPTPTATPVPTQAPTAEPTEVPTAVPTEVPVVTDPPVVNTTEQAPSEPTAVPASDETGAIG